MNTPPDKAITRREFLKTSAVVGGSALAVPSVLTGCASRKPSEKASIAAAAVAAPAAVAQTPQTLKVGLIGCGGRGSGAASQALNADPNVVLTAMGDAFAVSGSATAFTTPSSESLAMLNKFLFKMRGR